MRYLHACNLEAQRLFPLVQGISRVTQKDLVLSGYLVPAGTVWLLGISEYVGLQGRPVATGGTGGPGPP